MYEAGRTIKGMNLNKAEKYLKDVIEHKQVVAFKKFTHISRWAQAKQFKSTVGRWP